MAHTKAKWGMLLTSGSSAALAGPIGLFCSTDWSLVELNIP
jgi:hypothetical protein